jgi:hypothetical protein
MQKWPMEQGWYNFYVLLMLNKVCADKPSRQPFEGIVSTGMINAAKPDLGGASSSPPERRRSHRVRCQLQLEVTARGASYPLQVETTDVSLGGCYFATIFAIPVNTEVKVRMYLRDEVIACNGLIRTADPGLGNGLQFLDMSEEHQSLLKSFLLCAEAEETSSADARMEIIHLKI